MAKLPTDIPELVKQFGPTLHTRASRRLGAHRSRTKSW